jgi:hypothetical protein
MRPARKGPPKKAARKPAPPGRKLEPLQPLRGEPVGNLERREEHLRKRHGQH